VNKERHNGHATFSAPKRRTSGATRHLRRAPRMGLAWLAACLADCLNRFSAQKNRRDSMVLETGRVQQNEAMNVGKWSEKLNAYRD